MAEEGDLRKSINSQVIARVCGVDGIADFSFTLVMDPAKGDTEKNINENSQNTVEECNHEVVDQ